eukprot:4825214-Pyramimonas_sp.AAC.1
MQYRAGASVGHPFRPSDDLFHHGQDLYSECSMFSSSLDRRHFSSYAGFSAASQEGSCQVRRGHGQGLEAA